jgi:peptidoglycan/LPS O-acetylase OafA/YrhL
MKTAGLMTFPLYLVHTVVGATIMGRFVMLGLSRWAALAAGLAVIFLIAFLIAKYLEPAIQRVLRSTIYRVRDYWTKFRPAASKAM